MREVNNMHLKLDVVPIWLAPLYTTFATAVRGSIKRETKGEGSKRNGRVSDRRGDASQH